MDKTDDRLELNSVNYNVTKGKSLRFDPIFKSAKLKGEQLLKHRKKTYTVEMDSVNFLPDHFELVMDARGYNPEDIKCTITPAAIEITATRGDLTQTGSHKSMSTNRHYQLNRPVIPEKAICAISREGILMVSVPWATV